MSFRTFSPRNELEALDLINQREGILPIAGGTNVLVDIKQGKFRPDALLDLSNIEGWKKIEAVEGGLEIGSLVTHSELEVNPLVRKSFLALAMAASAVGSPQIRNRGTLGGNLQSASPAADCVPPLLVFDATLTLVSLSGRREVSVEDFFLGAGKTVRRPHELISKISLKNSPNQVSIFKKAGLRKALAISLVNLAACFEIDEQNRCRRARVAFGSVAPTPIRAKGIEAFLMGQIIDSDLVKKFSEIVGKEISPITDVRASAAYRKYLAEELLRESIIDLIRRRRSTDGRNHSEFNSQWQPDSGSN